MQSTRITKEGRVVPSNVYPEFNNAYQEWWKTHNQPPQTRKFDPDAEPWTNASDLDSVFPDKVVYTGRIDSANIIPSNIKNQVNLTNRLNSLARFAPGTWFCYDSYSPDTASLGIYCIHYVIAVETGLETVQWPEGNRPRTHLCVNAGNSYLQPSLNAMWVRWSDLGFVRQLTDSEMNRLVKKNVQLQNFVNQISSEYVAGTLKIQS